MSVDSKYGIVVIFVTLKMTNDVKFFFFVLTANSDPRDPEVKASYKLQLENVPEGKIHEVDKMSNESC